ncbi:unnamed protein product [Phytophthora lilii]|uniref:Unnamed protein product n=1 Tax=Phytophthora lilii TaxID=2077276 RepID=A0A9W6TPU7_9STRA|nr:unnamed protein product [Phytophthora lilii]
MDNFLDQTSPSLPQPALLVSIESISFLTVDLLQNHLAKVNHVKDRNWHKEDHVPVEFKLQAKFLPKMKRAPWRCPTWVLRDGDVKKTLVKSAMRLANSIRIFPGSNLGCLLDEHKRSDCVYLRRRWLELKGADARVMAAKIEAVNDAFNLFKLIRTEENKEQLNQAKADLRAHRANIKERNEANKFAADLRQSERVTKHFLRAPQHDSLRSPITELRRADGSITEDPAEIATGHREFWGKLFQSTSPDLKHHRTATYRPIELAKSLKIRLSTLRFSRGAFLFLLNNSPGEPFVLGAGVRQGDPLSLGLFVVFIEPMLNYLRKHFAPKGLLVRPSQTPHLLMAFADDCTGLLRDIADAKNFIRLVQDFSDAAGMRLNMKKTCVMPFTHHVSRAKLAMLRTKSALHVLGITDTTKLLGILQGASITPRERIAAVIRKLRNRCAIWKYRARTLKGKVVLLQTIILPLLWYTASVICVPPDVLRTVDIIIRNFVHSQDTDLDDAAPGKFDSN